MDKDFDEGRAFDDLRGILNHLYSAANFYQAEMQKAQSLNREKDFALDTLKAEQEKNLAALKNSYEGTIADQKRKISELEGKLSEQTENFQAQLKEYGDYNVDLTAQLKNFHQTLTAKENKLKTREANVHTAEENLHNEREKLDEERGKFDAEKSSLEEKVGRYEDWQNAASNFDEEKKKVRDEYEQQISELETKTKEYEETIKNLEEEKKSWQDKANNYKKQLDDLNDEIYNLKNSSAEKEW